MPRFPIGVGRILLIWARLLKGVGGFLLTSVRFLIGVGRIYFVVGKIFDCCW